MILKGYLFGIGYGLLCLLLSVILYKFGVEKKYTRKVVHILVGFEWVILNYYLGAGIHFLAVCIAFLVLLAVAYKGKFMPMISSDGDNAPGTVYYAVAMSGVAIVGCFVPDVMLPFGIGIFATSVGDGFAGVVGQMIKSHNPKIYKNKTLFGTLTNFIMTFISTLVLVNVFDVPFNIWHILAISFLSAELEVITGYGLDNIMITWGVTVLGYMFLHGIGWYFIIPILFTPIVIGFAIAKKALTTGGVITAILLDIVISAAYQNFGFTLLATFFIGGVLIDKIKRRVKGKSDEGLKGDSRDYMQVLANGSVAGAAALAYLIRPSQLFTVSFVASLAEALADTASSGIGAYSKNTYDIFKMKKTTGGLSGGVSLIGSFAGLVGAFFAGVVAYGFGVVDMKLLFVVTLAAFLGCMFDSLLGSLFQIKYKCSVCGKITEKELHCENKTEKYSGFSLIDNDVVNLLGTAFAAISAVILTVIIG